MIDHNDPRLTSYVLGELSHPEMMEIDQAIFESPELATVVEEIRSMVGLLGEAYVSEEKLSLSDEQKVAVTSMAEETNSGLGRRWVSLAVAASIALAIGGWIWQQYGQQDLPAVAVGHNGIEDIPTSSFPEVVYRFETRTRAVPIQKTRTETRTRTVPVTRTRTETRQVTLDDGTTVTKTFNVPYTENTTQNYSVQVPYTENTTQSYQVEVPYTADGQRIAVEDYGKYGINPEDVGGPAGSAESLPGVEVAMAGAADVRGPVTAGDFEKLTELVQDTVDSDVVKAFPQNLSLIVDSQQESKPGGSLRGEVVVEYDGVLTTLVPAAPAINSMGVDMDWTGSWQMVESISTAFLCLVLRQRM